MCICNQKDHTHSHTPTIAFRHLPPRKDVVNQCLEFDTHVKDLVVHGDRERERQRETNTHSERETDRDRDITETERESCKRCDFMFYRSSQCLRATEISVQARVRTHTPTDTHVTHTHGHSDTYSLTRTLRHTYTHTHLGVVTTWLTAALNDSSCMSLPGNSPVYRIFIGNY